MHREGVPWNGPRNMWKGTKTTTWMLSLTDMRKSTSKWISMPKLIGTKKWMPILHSIVSSENHGLYGLLERKSVREFGQSAVENHTVGQEAVQHWDTKGRFRGYSTHVDWDAVEAAFLTLRVCVAKYISTVTDEQNPEAKNNRSHYASESHHCFIYTHSLSRVQDIQRHKCRD